MGKPTGFIEFLRELPKDRSAKERISDWKAVSSGLQSPNPRVRDGLLLALEEVYDKEAVSALAGFASNAGMPAAERASAVVENDLEDA